MFATKEIKKNAKDIRKRKETKKITQKIFAKKKRIVLSRGTEIIYKNNNINSHRITKKMTSYVRNMR